MKRPAVHVPHLAGLYEIDRLADEAVALAEQIKATVATLREAERQPQDGGDDEPTQ